MYVYGQILNLKKCFELHLGIPLKSMSSNPSFQKQILGKKEPTGTLNVFCPTAD